MLPVYRPNFAEVAHTKKVGQACCRIFSVDQLSDISFAYIIISLLLDKI
jgi:hypothetical protein